MPAVSASVAAQANKNDQRPSIRPRSTPTPMRATTVVRGAVAANAFQIGIAGPRCSVIQAMIAGSPTLIIDNNTATLPAALAIRLRSSRSVGGAMGWAVGIVSCLVFRVWCLGRGAEGRRGREAEGETVAIWGKSWNI